MLKADELCLCSGTVATAGFRDLVEAAAAGGFHSISMGPQIYHPAREAGMTDRDMRRMMEERGLIITELDPLLKWLPAELLGVDIDAFGNPFLSATDDTFFRIADALGGRHLNVVQAFGPELPIDVYAECFARVCDRAAEHGLKVSLEFLPWSAIPDLGCAARIAEAAGRRNGGVMLDTWHHFRSGHGTDDLLALRGNVIIAIQINDATAQPWDSLPRESMRHRLLPGEGVIDLAGTIRALDSVGCDAPLGVEVFSEELSRLPPAQVARRAGDAARAVIAAALGRR